MHLPHYFLEPEMEGMYTYIITILTNSKKIKLSEFRTGDSTSV